MDSGGFFGIFFPFMDMYLVTYRYIKHFSFGKDARLNIYSVLLRRKEEH